MKTKTYLLAATLVASSIGYAAQAADDDSNPAPNRREAGAADKSRASQKISDSRFLRDAAAGSALEVKLGELAQQKAQNSEVKEFGETLAKEHRMACKELAQLGEQKGVQVPTEPPAGDRHLEHLAGLSGAEFDKAFIQHMIKDHTKDIRTFEQVANEGQDAEVKAFASKTLPILREHLKTAKSLAPTVGAVAEADDANEAAGAEGRKKPSYDKQNQLNPQPNKPGADDIRKQNLN